MFKFYKPKLWKRILGKLGVKKYQVNYFYGVDWATGDDSSCEVSGYYDKDGVFNVKSFKFNTPKEDYGYERANTMHHYCNCYNGIYNLRNSQWNHSCAKYRMQED